MKFSARQTEAAKSRHSLAGLIGRSVALKQHGTDFVGLCPFHKEKTPSFHVVEERGFYWCFGCGANGDAIKWVQWQEGSSFREAVARLLGEAPELNDGAPVQRAATESPPLDEEQLSNRERAAALWREAIPIADSSLGEMYFRRRGIIGAAPPSLRYHPSADYGTWKRLPAIVAIVTAPDRKFLGVWRIFLDPRGDGKAKVTKPKLGLGPVRGGAVHLSPLVGGRLDCGEGIETCRAVLQRHPDLGMWSLLSTSFMRKAILPPIKEIVVWEDRDAPDPRRELIFVRPDGNKVRRPNPNYGRRAGHEAALFLCGRAKVEQRARTAIISPGLGDGSDFNDVYRGDVA